MTDAYFVEVRSMGRWMPQKIYGGYPSAKTTSGSKRVFRREPQKINPGHMRLNLDQLVEVYSPDGRFTIGQGNHSKEIIL